MVTPRAFPQIRLGVLAGRTGPPIRPAHLFRSAELIMAAGGAGVMPTAEGASGRSRAFRSRSATSFPAADGDDHAEGTQMLGYGLLHW